VNDHFFNLMKKSNLMCKSHLHLDGDLLIRFNTIFW